MLLEHKPIFLLLGSNLGDRLAILNAAIAAIELRVGVLKSRSSVYETEAWGVEDQPSFLNIAIEISTDLEPMEVLDTILSIESDLGRVRHSRWAARGIDIDLIFYANEVIDVPEKLVVPHPHLQDRKFVLEPLTEIAPFYLHPVLKKSVSDLLASLQDKLSVYKINL